MDIQALKPRLGRWLTIDALRDMLSELPDDTCNQIPVNRKLLETASEFVEEKSGWWGHKDWEAFLDTLRERGFQLSDASRDPVGNILETFKAYYHNGDFQVIKDKKRKFASRRRKPRPA